MSLRLVLGGCAFALVGTLGTAHADPRAEELAQEAGELMFAEPPRYEEAIEKYTQAIVLSPEGKYYFNLCVAYYQYGEFGLALQACDAVSVAGGDAKLMEKTQKTLGKVEDQIRAMGQNPDDYRNTGGGGGDGGTGDGGTGDGGTGDGGTGDGGTGDGSSGTGGDGGTGDGGGGGTGTGGGGATGQPIDTSKSLKGAPPPSLFASKPPGHEYTWAVGGALLPMGTNVGGEFGGGSGFGFRGWVDYTVVPKMKIGVQGYIGVGAVTPPETGTNGITMAELGGAAYMHAVRAGRLVMTPLVGLQITGFAPTMDEGSSQVSFASLGLRAEVSFAYAFGKKYENVVHVTPGLNFFAPASGSADGGAGPSAFGLDESSRAIYLGLGFTRRFDTPFGQAPFITLE